jgi:uncharacterized membrane protein
MLDSDKKWAISCYIPVLNLVTCVLTSVRKVNSSFCLFHARQGLVLFGLWFLTIVVALVSQTLSLMLWGVVLLLHGSGAVLAFKNEVSKIPVLGDLAMKINEYYLFKLLTGKNPEKDATIQTDPQHELNK